MRTTMALLAALLLAACAPEPQLLASAQKPGYRTDSWPDQQRARTLRQGEGSRIYH